MINSENFPRGRLRFLLFSRKAGKEGRMRIIMIAPKNALFATFYGPRSRYNIEKLLQVAAQEGTLKKSNLILLSF